jgi:hypothetical protein
MSNNTSWVGNSSFGPNFGYAPGNASHFLQGPNAALQQVGQRLGSDIVDPSVYRNLMLQSQQRLAGLVEQLRQLRVENAILNRTQAIAQVEQEIARIAQYGRPIGAFVETGATFIETNLPAIGPMVEQGVVLAEENAPAIGVGVGTTVAAGQTGILAGIATLMAGISTTALVATGAGVIILTMVGGIIYARGEDPVALGPAALGPHVPQAVKTPISTGASAKGLPEEDHYFVFVAELSGGSIVVETERAMKGTEACRFGGGGLCTQPAGQNPKVAYRKVSKAFDTPGEATAAWCQEVKGKPLTNFPVANDSKAEVYGGRYWVGTAPPCPP